MRLFAFALAVSLGAGCARAPARQHQVTPSDAGGATFTPDDGGPGDAGDADAGVPHGLPGAPCTKASQCFGGADARCYVSGNSCGNDGFCTLSCDAQACPAAGDVCLELHVLDDQAQPSAIHRCFIACAVDADCNAPGRLACDTSLHVCYSGQFLSDLGSTGGSAPDGGACAPNSATLADAGYADGGAWPLGAFGPNVDVSAGAGDEPSLAVSPDGGLLAAWNFGVAASTDDGHTWTPRAIDDPGYGGDPALAFDPAGRAYFAYLTSPQGGCTAGAASIGKNTIGVMTTDDLGASWKVGRASDPKYTTDAYFLDKPWLATGPEGNVYVSYTVFPTGAAQTTDVVLASSVDRGATWTSTVMSDPMSVRPLAGRSLTNLAVDGAGAVWSAWLEDAAPPATGSSVWLASSPSGGRAFAKNLHCCGDDATYEVPALAVSPDGREIVVAYGRVSGPYDAQDLVAYTYRTDTQKWQGPFDVSPDASCATHRFPWLALDPVSKTLHAIWVDNRSGRGEVRWGSSPLSDDGTLSFTVRGDASDATAPFTTSRQRFFVGDYLQLVYAQGALSAVWGDARAAPGGDSQIFFSKARLR